MEALFHYFSFFMKKHFIGFFALFFIAAAIFVSGSTVFAEENDTDASASTNVSAGVFADHPGFKELLERFKAQFEALRTNRASTTAVIKDELHLRRASSTVSVDATCMQGIVATRESSLQSAWSTLNTNIVDALDVRAAALNTAWGVSETGARNSAIKSAWSDWKKAHRDAFSTMRQARRDAWETFRKAARDTCKTSIPKEEGLSSDSAGSVSI